MKAVIMAGGKGTRVASITNDEFPKPMLKIDGIPILEHQIKCLKDNGIDDIIITVGHLGGVITDYFGDGSRLGVKIDYIFEDENKPLGTAGALYYLKGKINDDFVLVFGDVFFDVDFQKMIDFHKKNRAVATLLTHPNSHPFDSDLLVVNEDNVVIGFDSKENDRSTYDYQNIVNSGIYVFSPEILKVILEPMKMAIEKDVVANFIEKRKVYSYHSTEYVKDMGTPERYESVNLDYKNKIPWARNLKNKQKCIFLDRDGTINEDRGYITDKKDLVLMDGVAEAIKRINSSEYLCIAVTNQPVIARGQCTVEGLNEIHKHLETLLGREGAYIDGLYYCPHHPDKGFKGEVLEYKIDCDCRKPKIGMVKKAAEYYNIDLESSYMIGDSWRDIEMGKNAKMYTYLIKNKKSRGDPYLIMPDEQVDNLLEAVNKIIGG
ncbi:HAD-IIIA family hydrolase [Candidatus Saccharibacteria bacterium]|nr:HAD-IIIA family hydrolase [Candidatus Saccharibacteria bacterium]